MVEKNKKTSAGRRFLAFAGSFAADRIALSSFIVLFCLIVAAVLAPVIMPTDPYDLTKLDIMNSRLPPGAVGDDGTVFWLGTDGQGRDLLSAIFYGLRLSISIAFICGLAAFSIGTTVGLVSGYFGGTLDRVIMRLVDLQLSFPAILVALVILGTVGGGITSMVIVLVAVQWANYCRTVRASVLVEKSRAYIEAATGQKLGNARIMFGHLFPNCISPAIVLLTVQAAGTIALESSLSFLGVGLPPTEPSLGLLIANGFQFVLSGDYWISIFPGVALIILIVCINICGDRIRDMLNPLLRG